MAWETRNGRGRYYTRSRRRNGRVVREYVGTGEVAELVALIDEQERALREAEADAGQAAVAEMQALEAAVADVCQLVDLATRLALVPNGYHQHHRGEWRYQRVKKEKNAVAAGGARRSAGLVRFWGLDPSCVGLSTALRLRHGLLWRICEGRAMSDVIRFACGSCGHKMAVGGEHAGKRAKCRKCGGVLTIRPPSSNFTESVAGAAVSTTPPRLSQPPVPQVGTLLCPHCSGAVAMATDLLGQRVVCPHCARQFQMPGNPRFVPPPVPPPIPPCPEEPVVAQLVEEPVITQLVDDPFSVFTGQRRDFRHHQEQIALVATLALTTLALVLLFTASVGLFLVVVILLILLLPTQEKRRIQSLVPITAHTHPEIYSLTRLAAQRLFMPVPGVYLSQDVTVNAFAMGCFSPAFICLNTGAVQAFSPSQLLFVIGHELAHVKLGHTTWLTFSETGRQAIVHPALGVIMEFAFHSWSRVAEHSADRGGLLACANLDDAVMALAILEERNHGVSLDELRRRIQSTGTDYSDVLCDHPTTAKRVRALAAFHNQVLSQAC